MPIVSSSNNRVLPNNARAVDVAKESVKRIAPVQARRYDAAFRVQGYNGILYTRLTQGTPCSCCNQVSAAANQVRLDAEGRADAGTINSLLTGKEFGTAKPLGQVAATTIQAKKDMLEIAPIGYQRAGIKYPDRTGEPIRGYEMDSGNTRSYVASTASDHWSTDERSESAKTIVDSGVGPNGPVADSEEVEESLLSTSDHGGTDSSCPICFGSGFVGGYSVFRGWRKVLVPNGPEASMIPGGSIDMMELPWTADVGCEWEVVFPLGAVNVDSVRVLRDDATVFGARIYVDGTQLTAEYQLATFCDGYTHTVRVELPEGETFSHVELQINQSHETANFEFPRQSKNADMSFLERTDPFQLVFSPLIPLLKTQDIIVESVTGKVLQVKECTPWNDNRVNMLGWEANVRVTQPLEIFAILPKRKPLGSPHTVAHVIDNSYGHRRT